MMRPYIIGAGVTGLSFAKVYGPDAIVLESKDELGGKALSYNVETNVGNFGFDIGGHWFHYKSAPESYELLKGLDLDVHKRHAYVYLDNLYLDFPIQQSYKTHNNIEFVKEVDREMKEIRQGPQVSYHNYEEMLRKSYGTTLFNSFFRDYNQKMYGIQDLRQIRIGLHEEIRNVRLDREVSGYNGEFVYPKRDIGAKGIPLFLAEDTAIHFNKKVTSINLQQKTMRINNTRVPWENLVSTMPLSSLVSIIQDIDRDVLEQAKDLTSSKGMILNLGVKRSGVHSNKSWIYIPGKEYCFYRIGFYSNVQPMLAPEGYVSMYVECSPLFFNNKQEAHQLVPRVIRDLIRLGMICNEQDIITKRAIYLEHNYCLPDIQKTKYILDYLRKFGIYSIGRYGSWHWSSQHEDMQQAIQLAKMIKKEKYNPVKISL